MSELPFNVLNDVGVHLTVVVWPPTGEYLECGHTKTPRVRGCGSFGFDAENQFWFDIFVQRREMP